jgi:hypothetical protein
LRFRLFDAEVTQKVLALIPSKFDMADLRYCFVDFQAFMAVTMKDAVFWDIKNPSSYLLGDTLHLRYRAQLVNAM